MSTTLDIQAIRSEFPYLTGREDHLVYLDSGASAQKPLAVLDAMHEFAGMHYANVHRGVHPLAVEADNAFNEARKVVAEFVNGSPKTTVFGKNVTEMINLVAWTWGISNVAQGDEIVITQMEHHANLVPWQQLCNAKGATLRYLEIDPEGKIDLQQLEDFLAAGKVKLVAAAHVSNVLGTVNPVKEIVDLAKRFGAVSLIDGAQAVPQRPVDVEALDADFYAWTGHKLYGPTGIGVLHGRSDLLSAMDPFLMGGDMVHQVGMHQTTFAPGIQKFEAGTPPIVEAVGLAAAAQWLQRIGGGKNAMSAVHDYEQQITGYALQQLSQLPGIKIVGPKTASKRGALVAFEVEGVHPHDVAELLARDGVCVRAGQHCAEPLHTTIGVMATTRASFSVTTTTEEIDALCASLLKVQKLFS